MKDEMMDLDYFEKNVKPVMFDVNPSGDLVYNPVGGGREIILAHTAFAGSRELVRMLVETKYLMEETAREFRRVQAALSAIEKTIELLNDND